MNDLLTDPRVVSAIQQQPYPLLFLTVSGAHLYGFPSGDSDYDLRGCHVLPLNDVLGLEEPRSTVDFMDESRLIDVVTHDVAKYFRLLLKKNGYVLEQIYSPLVLYTTPEHAELTEIAHHTLTRHHYQHYLGFGKSELKLIAKHPERRVKRLLYLYRIYLTGIHLMNTGEVQANLPALLSEYRDRADYAGVYQDATTLMEHKMLGYEGMAMPDEETTHYLRSAEQLEEALKSAGLRSELPDEANGKPALNELLLRVRKRYGGC